MVAKNPKRKRSPQETVDDFMAAVPWGGRRVVLVYHRQHGGRTYVRLRTWNHHRGMDVWYPTKRFYVIPDQNAKALAEAIVAAADQEPQPKPDWLMAWEQEHATDDPSLSHAEAKARHRTMIESH